MVLLILLFAFYLTYKTLTSPFGLRLLAIRDDEILASSLGVNTDREKLKSMAVHAGLAGLLGGTLALNFSYIEPNNIFVLRYTELPIIVALIGGMGTLIGQVLGALLYTITNEFFWTRFPNIYKIFLGAVVIVIVVVMPEGIIEYMKEKGYLPRHRWL